MPATLVWFRQDLRLRDNPAFSAAVRRGVPVVPVYVLDDAAEGAWKFGGASRWWLHHSLRALSASLAERGLQLVLKRGDAATVLSELAEEVGADALHWNARWEPNARVQETDVTEAVAKQGMQATAFVSALLHDPSTLRNRQGKPFQVFTPFWRHCLSLPVSEAERLPAQAPLAPGRWPESLSLDALQLLPRLPWADEFSAHWQPGEESAREKLRRFVERDMAGYEGTRNLPSVPGTSTLSAHLHFGEISPRQVWAAVRWAGKDSGVFPPNRGASVFLGELGWREFAHHLLAHFPQTVERPLRAPFERFPWAADGDGERWRAWTRGQTGYPIVDGGMRQLWRTGWMHNRVRMIVASFLVKHLRIDWRRGAAWFWDTLVDADLANNTLGWQWSAGCGADAAPYFRIFAPVAQGEKFDASGEYVRRWVPELAQLPPKHLHAPWAAPAHVLAAAGVRLGETYPWPVVDHAKARAEALAAFKSIRTEEPL